MENTAHEQLTPITSDTFPTGLTSPSRTHGHTTNIHFAPSVLGFHPTEMMYGFGTADGLVRLIGCQFSSGKQEEDEVVGRESVSTFNGMAEQLPSKPRINFPTMQ